MCLLGRDLVWVLSDFGDELLVVLSGVCVGYAGGCSCFCGEGTE